MIFTVLGAIGLHSYVPDLVCHFFMQYLGMQVAFFVCLIVARRRLEALVVLVTILILAFEISPLFIPVGSQAEGRKLNKIKLLQVNVNSSNTRTDLVVDCVKKFEPDVVLFEEINARWLDALKKGLPRKYAIVEARSREDNFGIAMFSCIPKVDSRLITVGYFKVPAVAALFQKENERLIVLGAHVLPPHSESNFTDRNLAYDEMAIIRKKLKGPFVLMGDLNTTTWSPYFNELLKNAQLKDSTRGFGWQPTWPVQVPFLGLDLDHCLISRDLVVLKRQPGPAIGSDHLPLYVEIGVEPGSRAESE